MRCRSSAAVGTVAAVAEQQRVEPWDGYSRREPPRGYRHPITQSELRVALTERGVRVGHVGLWLADDPLDEVAGVYWHTDSDSGYRKSNMRLSRDGGSSLLVVNAVPSTERLAVHEALVSQHLADLIEWAQRAQESGNAWQASRHFLRFRRRDGRVEREDS